MSFPALQGRRGRKILFFLPRFLWFPTMAAPRGKLYKAFDTDYNENNIFPEAWTMARGEE